VPSLSIPTTWFAPPKRRALSLVPNWRVEEGYMRLALYVARNGEPAPNPRVGAVVASGGRIISVGYHRRAGEAHAEVEALREAGLLARGATLYVTLEPCNHEGRTPPCVDAILRAGIDRVVIGCEDPNPFVRGGGAERLERNGVQVVRGVLRAQAEDLISDFSARFTRERARRT
jgi:diaminohydroxyphosphoribosylaminopyrimidine deaminase/5-amino-6-(5-phosphoribosylamino)uracil reductase